MNHKHHSHKDNLQQISNEKITRNTDVCETLMPPFPNISRIGLTFDLDLSPTDLIIDRGHLLIKDFQPTMFEASAAKHS